MLKSTMKYGAIRAKVMAMQGKMLTAQDFDRLCECTDITEVVNFLRSHRGWSETVSKLPAPVSTDALKAAVSGRVWLENEKLYHFSGMKDKAFLRFAAAKGEYGLILSALRRLSSSGASEKDSETGNVPRTADFLRNKSTIDTKELEICTNWHDLIEAVSGSIFEKGLRSLEIDQKTQLPNYSAVSVLLENTYYREVFSYIAHKTTGLAQKQLRQMYGQQADFLNIVSILRLHRYFPNSLLKADQLLVPVAYRIKPDITSALISAQNEAEAINLLRDTKYGELFQNVDGKRLEAIHEKALSEFCRKLVIIGEPSAGTAPAYLALKEIECNKLVRVIEAVRLGVDPKNAM